MNEQILDDTDRSTTKGPNVTIIHRIVFYCALWHLFALDSIVIGIGIAIVIHQRKVNQIILLDLL